MKRSLGRMAMNWLRNPQNQEKVKHTARQLYARYQQRKRGDAEHNGNAGHASRRTPSSQDTPGAGKRRKS